MNLTEVDLKNHTEVLPNGLTVVTIEMPHVHNLEISMFVKAGLRFEDESDYGISHFIEHMLFRGNRRHPSSLELNRAFEATGREPRAYTLTEYTYYSISPHISQLNPALELFAEFFIQPTFSDLEVERAIILEECLEELNEKGENIDIDNLACRLLYPGTSLAMPTIGTQETIAGITLEKLRDYFGTYYIAPNMILCGAGPIQRETFNCLAKQYFSSIPSEGRAIPWDHFLESIQEEQSEPETLFQYDPGSQVQMQVCFRALSYNDPDYYTLYLINRIFDDGYTSRLQRALREDRGLVYSVESRVTSLSDVGTVDFDINVRPEKLVEVMRILFYEIKNFLDHGPTREELDLVKKRYYYELDTEQDDPHRQIFRFAFPMMYSQEILTVGEEWAVVEGLTPEYLREVARKIFVREGLSAILVGPYTPELQQELEAVVKSF